MPTPMEIINADTFSATDKKNVIEMLVSNEHVLLFLYEKLFPKKEDPVLKQMQSTDSYVFMGNKMGIRGQQSGPIVNSSALDSVPVMRSPKANP